MAMSSRLETSKITEEIAATRIQRLVWGFFSRKKTNIYGQSEGKEIEIYLPFGIKKIDSDICTYDMIGNYKYIVCESSLFYVQIDHMNFKGQKKLKIPEIVTAPFRKPGETRTNLPSEEMIDKAVGDFITLISDFTQGAAREGDIKKYLRLNDLIKQYNARYPKYPLRLSESLKEYLVNPQRKALFTGELEPIEEHKNIEICLIFDPNFPPVFDSNKTPRTFSSAEIIENNQYTAGKLLIHIQKSFSLPVKNYKPDILVKALHNTDQQLQMFAEARKRAEAFIKKHPVPLHADQEKMLGFLTICTEHILTVTYGEQYVGLHEKADRPVLSIRHILHYVKQLTCNQSELNWFDKMFRKHRDDIKIILCGEDLEKIICEDRYVPDYRGKGEGGYSGLNSENRYDVIFDLFGSFKNGYKLTIQDVGNPLNSAEIDQLKRYGIVSWARLFSNHMSLTGRTHLRLQKVINEKDEHEYHLIFEARRIGLMTIDEFKTGASSISLVHHDDSVKPTIMF